LLKAELELLAENHDGALDAYQKASDIDPTDLKLLERTSGLKTYLCDFDGAINDLLKIVEVEKNAEIFYNIAFLYFKLNRENEALKTLDEAIKLNPKYRDALMQKGILNYWTQNYEESIKMFDSLSQLDPTFEKPIIYKARALMKMGNSQKAADELSKIEIGKRDSEYLLLSSQLNYIDNNFCKAQKNIEKYKNFEGENSSIQIIDTFLKVRDGDIENVSELNEFDFSGDEKKNAQIINASISYEKGQYNTAKFRFSNISGLSSEKKSLLEPLIQYSEKQIAKT
jgi:tetratricopeptide (TPR) repeat protein